MRDSNSTGSDPRQPSTAKPYVPPPISSQDLPVDYAGFLAVVLGVIGVMFRIDDEDSFEMISNNKHYPKLQHVPKIISKRQFLRAC